MDAIRSFACDNPAISNQVENVYKLLYEVTLSWNLFVYFGKNKSILDCLFGQEILKVLQPCPDFGALWIFYGKFNVNPCFFFLPGG